MIEKQILSNLIYDLEFTKKALPFIREEYFSDITERKIFSLIGAFYEKYTKLPSKEALLVEFNNASGLSDDQSQQGLDYISGMAEQPEDVKEWLTDKTEKFCQL